MLLSAFLVVLVSVNALACETESRLNGKIANQVFPIHVQLAERDMLVTISRPGNAPDDFRETTNLHIFESHLMALKNEVEKHCYIARFADSHDQIKGRVMNAEYNNGRIGNVAENLVSLEGIPPLSNRTVRLLLGRKIAEFCSSHDVYVIDKENQHVFSPKGVDIRSPMEPKSGAVRVVGICCCDKDVID